MKASEKAAVEVAKKMGVIKEGQAFDPSIILTLAPIIVELITVLQACRKTPEAAVKTAKNLNMWQKLALRVHVRRSMSYKEYRQHGDKFVNAIVAAAKTSSVPLMKELYKEAE
jgi:hypothetical protein